MLASCLTFSTYFCNYKARTWRQKSRCLWAATTHLSIEQRRIVVDIGYLHSERAHALQAGITLIGCLHRHRHELAIVTLTIEHLVRGHFAGLLVDGEFGALLIRLLHNRVFNLTGDKNMQNSLMIDTVFIIMGVVQPIRHDTTCNVASGQVH